MTDVYPDTNWDGNKVPDGPWYDQGLFTIGDFKVTVGEATISTIVLMIVGALIAVACLHYSYRKRKIILKNAKIAGEAVRRNSLALRASISRGSGSLGADLKR